MADLTVETSSPQPAGVIAAVILGTDINGMAHARMAHGASSPERMHGIIARTHAWHHRILTYAREPYAREPHRPLPLMS